MSGAVLMERARNGVRKITPTRVYTEVVDGETFTLKQADRPDPDPWDPREYLISRNGEAVLGVQARAHRSTISTRPKTPTRTTWATCSTAAGARFSRGLSCSRGGSPRRSPSWERVTSDGLQRGGQGIVHDPFRATIGAYRPTATG